MKIIDFYIIKKFLGTFFYAISLLIIVVIVFDVSERIESFIEKEAPLQAIIFSYYFNFIPFFVNLFSHLFTFISVIFFTSKMASNSELIAILSNGVSFRRILVPYFISASIIGLISFFLAIYVIPHTNRGLYEFENKYILNQFINKEKNIHLQIEPDIYIYMRNFDNIRNRGYNFSIEKFENGRLVSKLMANKIKWDTTNNKWILKNYVLRNLGHGDDEVITGNQMDTTLNLFPSEFKKRVDDVKIMTLQDLNEGIRLEKLKGSNMYKEYEVEKHKRIAFPFATIILTLIGVSLSSRKIRGGIGMHLGLGLVLAFGFILFMKVSTVFATKGNLDAALSVWIPNIVFGLLSLYLIRLAPK